MEALLKDKIKLISILDLLSISVLLSSIPPTILKSGGTLLHLGCLMSLGTIMRFISTDIYRELRKLTGQRQLLKYSLIASGILNASLLLTSTYQSIMINRLLFTLVHQVQVLTAELSVKQKEDNKDKSFYHNPKTQRLSITLLGCVFVGSLIDSKGGFHLLVAISTALTGTAFAILRRLESSEKNEEKQLSPSAALSVIPKTFKNLTNSVLSVDIHFSNWEALAVKVLFLINAKVVFILCVVLIIFVFEGRGKMVSSISAYQSIVLFIIADCSESISREVSKIGNTRKILEYALRFTCVCAFLLAFSPNHIMYLVIFPLFALGRSVVETNCAELFEFRKNQKLRQDIETITVITEILGSVIVGFLFYLLKQNAYRLLAVTPFLAIYFIFKNKQNRFTSIKNKFEPESIEKNKDK